jgi:lysophospholipase L1-like esterase
MSDKFFINNTRTAKRSSSFPYLFTTFSVLALVIYSFILVGFNNPVKNVTSTSGKKWVGTWTTSPQLVEPRNNPPKPGLSNNTLRQVVCVSIGGDSLRIRFTNEFSKSPVTMKAVHIALSVDSSKIDPKTDLTLKFNGNPEITLEPGTAITSDPFHFKIKPRTNLAITIYFGNTSPDVTGHPGSRTTSYLLTGEEVSAVDFPNAVTTDHWYIINGIDVVAPESATAVVVLGNSITDGRGSGTNKQNRWPDVLAERLLKNPETEHVAVLNAGIGGNCVLRQCLGPSALSRFDRDVIGATGVRWLIILEGINDIGGSREKEGAAKVADDLIVAYEQMIDSAHANGILVYGATIMPFGGSFYDSPDHEKAKQKVNEWIRTSGRFDAVIDLDATMQDPENPLQLLPAGDTGDHLHPNEIGHRMMAEAVDLNLFK